jgi:hypothetical protein
MADKKQQFETGDRVLIRKKHLHGIAADIQAHSESGEAIARINEGALEGTLVQFPESDLVGLESDEVSGHHQTHLEKFKPGQETPEGPLEVSPGDRLPWNYQD